MLYTQRVNGYIFQYTIIEFMNDEIISSDELSSLMYVSNIHVFSYLHSCEIFE